MSLQISNNSKNSTATGSSNVQMDLSYGLEQLIDLDQNQFNQQGRELYTWTGVLQFLNQYQRISKLKEAEWQLEKQQLHNRANFLQQQLAAQEILNKDLIKRVKMLEYALRQERISYSKKFDPFPSNRKQKFKDIPAQQKQDQSQNPLANQKVRNKLESLGMYPFDSVPMNTVMLAKISERQAKSRKPLISKFLEEVGYADIFEQYQSQQQQHQQQYQQKQIIGNDNNNLLSNQDNQNQYSFAQFNGQQGFQVKKQQQQDSEQLSQKHLGLFSRNITPNSGNTPPSADINQGQRKTNEQLLKSSKQI